MYPVPSPTALAFVHSARTRHSQHSHHHPLPVGLTFRGYRFACATTCRVVCLPWRTGPGSHWPTETFTSGLSTGWSPFPSPDIATVATGQVPPAGLPPAGMTASVAARRISDKSRVTAGCTPHFVWPSAESALFSEVNETGGIDDCCRNIAISPITLSDVFMR